MDFYSIVGCTVSYFCNFSYSNFGNLFQYVSTGCWAGDRQGVANEINLKCGGYGGGWDVFSTANNLYNGQYGWESQCISNSFVTGAPMVNEESGVRQRLVKGNGGRLRTVITENGNMGLHFGLKEAGGTRNSSYL
jgi:hypothetical protein